MLYSTDQYGLVQYGAGTTDGSPSDDGGSTSSSYTELRRYLPRFMWEELREMDALLKAQGYEIGRMWDELDDSFKQTYVESATWGLQLWERLLALPVSLRKPYDARRAAVKARLQVCATCTPELLATLAQSTTGVEAIVTEDTANYEFTICFVGAYGIPKNMQTLREAVEIAKPAHLNCLYKFKYTIWNELKPFTWNDLKPYTWDGLRIMEITQRVTWNGVKTAGFTYRSIKRYTCSSIKNAQEAMV